MKDMDHSQNDDKIKSEERKKWIKDHKFPVVNIHEKIIDQSNPNIRKKEEIAYKYSKKGKSELRESIILDGNPTFIKYRFIEESGKHFTKLEPTIEEQTRIIRPPHLEEYPYEPYEFGDVGEPQYYLNRAINQTIDSIYGQIKNIFAKFNDVDSKTIFLLSAYTLSSYFQDRFSTVHYLIIVGDNGTGKSAIGDTFESLGYRAVSITDATPATWYRVLGSIEYGQVTIIADEADNIGESIEVMSIQKTDTNRRAKSLEWTLITRNNNSFILTA